jgi:hypothetical protein
MWYIYEVIGQSEDLIGRFPTQKEAEEYARQIRAERPGSLITVSPGQEEAFRLRDQKQRKGRTG